LLFFAFSRSALFRPEGSSLTIDLYLSVKTRRLLPRHPRLHPPRPLPQLPHSRQVPGLHRRSSLPLSTRTLNTLIIIISFLPCFCLSLPFPLVFRFSPYRHSYNGRRTPPPTSNDAHSQRCLKYPSDLYQPRVPYLALSIPRGRSTRRSSQRPSDRLLRSNKARSSHLFASSSSSKPPFDLDGRPGSF
jgi:hypothetical protein